MNSDAEILQKAHEREHDPRRPTRFKPWQHHAVGATVADINRLMNEGLVKLVYSEPNRYLLTEKGEGLAFPCAMEREMERVSREEILQAMDLIVGFDDLKQMMADAITSQRKICILLQGPPACAKSLMLDAIRSVVPSAYMAFGSRTSAAGLSDVLFEFRPNMLLLDEADKLDRYCYSVMLGLMEKGEILETKSGRTRGITLNTSVIAGCNRSDKMTPEFLSRFAFHAHFPEYTRQEFIDVVVGMLAHAEDCPSEIAEMIGIQVHDMGLGDVRKARGIWQLMKAPTIEEVKRIIHLSVTYGPQNDAKKPKKQLNIARLPGI
jgi:hypothetical protein